MKKRILSLILSTILLLSLAPQVFAASLQETYEGGQTQILIRSGTPHSYLDIRYTDVWTAALSGRAWSYITADGQVTGPAYCVDHGGNFPSGAIPVDTTRYTAKPQTMGAFANGYPQRSLLDFLSINCGNYPELTGLTEEEFAYSTQLSVWATLDQIAVEGTAFTSGQGTVVEPTDAAKLRVFRALQIILANASTWDRSLSTGLHIRAEENSLGDTIDLGSELSLKSAAENGRYGIKKETISGTEYYTREFTVSSATSTYPGGYKILLATESAPAGTIFAGLTNTPLEYSGGNWEAVADKNTFVDESICSNGSEYASRFKLCIPVAAADETAAGSITIRAYATVTQYAIYSADNTRAYEQSFIIADPSTTDVSALGYLKWGVGGGSLPDPEDPEDPGTASVQLTKTDGTGGVLRGAVFELIGSGNYYASATTDASGRILWTDLPADQGYTVRETTAPEGYRLAAPVSVSVTAGQTSYVTISDGNEKYMRIHKQDAQNSFPLSGATFRLEQVDGSFAIEGRTFSDGVLQFSASELPFGSYRITETYAPDGFEPDRSSRTVYWDGTEDVNLYFTNVRKMGFDILKVDAITGVPLTGAVFDIYKDGAKVTSVQTNEAGLASVSGLSEGYYEAVERVAPAGYVLDETPYGIHLNPYDPATTDNPILRITNRATPSLRIVKYDAQTMAPIPNTTFEVYKDSALLGEYSSDANGEIYLYDLAPGTYLAKEVSTDNAHVVNSTPQQIELEAGGNGTLVFFNYLKPGIHLRKVDSRTLSPLPNAKFRITQVGGTFSQEYTTDANGEIDLTALDPGSYTVTELAAPDHYLIDDAQRIIRIEGGDNAEFLFTNTLKPSLKLIKLDSLTGERLAGATYRIAKIADGSHYLDRVTDINGEIQITDLEPGVYSVQEITAPEGYVLDTTEYHVELFAGQMSQLVVSDDHKPDMRILKQDADTGAFLNGAVFTVKKADGATLTSELTDTDGEILLQGLEPGVYEVIEQEPPVGYLPARENMQLITLTANKLGTVIFSNYEKPTLTVNKISSVSGEALQGAKFNVTYRSNNTETGSMRNLGIFLTDENGQFHLSELTDGWYTITELESVPGYSIREATQEVYIKGGEDKVLTFRNTPLSALVVYKYDSVDGTAVANAVFQVKKLTDTSGTGGTVIGQYITKANGSFTVTGLDEGVYIVEELASDSGHVIDTAPQTAYISGRQTDVVELYFGNSPKGSVLITKKDAVTGEPLADVEFLVTDSVGTLLGNANGKYVTDSAGSILIAGIDPGVTLVVKETRAKSGYVLDDAPRTVKVISGRTVTLEFRNKPKGSLVVQKIDSITKEPLAGAVFKITTSNGTFLDDNEGLTSSTGLYTTDENGQIYFSKLTPATYIITEQTAPENYKLASNAKTVVVRAADTQTVTIADDPLCTLTILKRDAVTKEPLKGAEFVVKYSDGSYAGSNNGRYTTGSDGTITVSGLRPDATVMVTEQRAPTGYLKDGETKSTVVRSGVANSLTFDDEPTTTLVVQKYVTGTTTPIRGVRFLLTDDSGAVVGPDNGEYTTDEAGRFTVTGLEPGMTVTARELSTVSGYVLDATPKSIQIKEGQIQTLTFFNDPKGTLIIQKVDRETGASLAGAEFLITTIDGNYLDDNEGRTSTKGVYATDSNGEIRLLNLEPNTYSVKETKAPEGYVLTPEEQTVRVNANDTQTIMFKNAPLQTFVLQKYIEGTTTPLAGVTFLVTDGAGNPVGSSNGEHVTDANGRIVLTGVAPGTTLVAKEIRTVEGYVLNTEPQTILVGASSSAPVISSSAAVNGSSGNQLTFYDSPLGSVELIKVDAANRSKRLSGAVFEIRKPDGALVTTVTTDRNGRVSVELDAGDYCYVEITAPDGYKPDAAPGDFKVTDGKTTTLTVTNAAISGIVIHKTDATTGKGIYGVTFLLYDSGSNPIGQYSSDDQGYVRIENLEAGRYYLRELDNEGYVLDTQLKTVNVKSGETTLVEWKNTPITGQIQITKTSADYNSVNGWAAGTPIPDTVFEIYNKAGLIVDTVQTDKNGVASSRPLPLGRYKIIESRAAANYALDKTPMEVEIEFSGQIVRAAMTNKSLYTNVSIKKTGYAEVMPGQTIQYTLGDIGNNSNSALTSFFWRDTLPAQAVRLDKIVTGTWNAVGNYKLVYKTNESGDTWRTLADNLSTFKNYVLDASPTALNLGHGEYVTEFMFSFGVVPANFRQVEAPKVYCTVYDWLAGGEQFTNTADAGGVYNGQWIMGVSKWTTRIYRPEAPSAPLPLTGY